MLPLPKLDDRSYDEIRDEAIRNIMRHCPDWTNHNASDPGITLIELFASMTEMLQYRINRVPEKNYLAFLDMLGITGRLPTPAKTRLQFKLSDGYELNEKQKSVIKIDKNLVVTTDETTKDDEPIIFETEKETQLSNVKLINIFSKLYDKEKEQDILVEHFDMFEKEEGFTPFERTEKSTNNMMIYLYSEALSSLKDKSLVSILFHSPTDIEGLDYEREKGFLKRLDWEYYNGTTWKPLTMTENSVADGIIDENSKLFTVTFDGKCGDFEKSTFSDIVQGEHYFVRAILKGNKQWLSYFSVYQISLAIKSRVAGVIPEGISYMGHNSLDLNSDFFPFGEKPMTNKDSVEDHFYIKSQEAFSKKGADVTIKIKHSENRNYNGPYKEGNVKLIWEYYTNTENWKRLDVEDSTNNFLISGTVTFTIPQDISTKEIGGDKSHWVKCKIVSGHYGKEEKYRTRIVTVEKEGEKSYETVEELIGSSRDVLNPPRLSYMVISYQLKKEEIERCTIYNNYTYNQKEFKKNYATRLFDQLKSKEQSLNFCFDSFINKSYIDLYFNIDEYIEEERNLKRDERLLGWKILTEEGWKPLKVEDSTDELTRSGELRIHFPQQKKLMGMQLNGKEIEGMWIKAEVKFNALPVIPKIYSILTNTVIALQKESFENEFIGKSIGLPEMSFLLNHKNIIEPPTIKVGGEEFRYVKRFIEQGKEDKVFRFYGITGEVKFGDGKYGEVPPPYEDIYAKYYATTLGKMGNLDSDKVTNLRQNISFVESVSNIIPAIGGADGDRLDDLKKYAPSEFKTRDRAITAEDYEYLTKDFSSNIINAKAVAENGDVSVVVVTQDVIEENGFINRKLIQDLEEYLQSKSLVTVRPFVKSPRVVPVTIKVKVKKTNLQNEISIETLESRLNEEAKQYFSLTEGGEKQDGYPMGRNITLGDLYKLLNRVDTSLYFGSYKIDFDNNNNKISLHNYDTVVKFEKLTVEDLSHDA